MAPIVPSTPLPCQKDLAKGILLASFMIFRGMKIGRLMGNCAMCPDGDRHHPGNRDEGEHNVVVAGNHRGGVDLRVRVIVRMVVGATRVAHS